MKIDRDNLAVPLQPQPAAAAAARGGDGRFSSLFSACDVS